MKIRSLFFTVLLAFAMSSAINLAQAAKNPTAVSHMKRLATALVSAQKVGTRSAFRNVISKYADLPAIAMYSLGRYRGGLKKARRARYFRGVNAFMGRYFATESKRYKVAKTQIDPNVKFDGKDTLIKTKVIMKSGDYYTVVWRLAKRRNSYKVTDVKVLGFSLTYLQRGMFSSYIKKKGGSVEALIKALNRHY
jgi:phospholipid transport system substrate-binding protein